MQYTMQYINLRTCFKRACLSRTARDLSRALTDVFSGAFTLVAVGFYTSQVVNRIFFQA